MDRMEYSRHGFCDALPQDVRETVEMMALEFLPETWPIRFVALLSMLEDITGKVEEVHRPYVVNNWVAIVSGLLEHLPRDLASPECLALMRHSVLDRFRQSAIQQSPDVEWQNEMLRREYPQWSIAEDLLRDYETWAAKQSQIKPN
ncbi:hypothetical protein G6L13_25915 [Agrobacterium tumefaciens]|uniref:hypothetical protein n=2 Tax=Rhizobium/Agrobacterium group TaxID=227290 RepID=UPI001571E747|nr:hypothetical protein [Agrobacterium tumefaciens]NTA83923.1 hypothetical protein [Agrobacterium tumefaciens]